MRLCIVIVNHRTPSLVLDAVSSLDGQVDPVTDQVIVVDNDSRDGSVPFIEAAITQRGYGAWCSLVRAPRNSGLAAGNNVGIRAADADFYLLLDCETRVAPGAIATLLSEMKAYPLVGIAGPRLETPEGEFQLSCFRDHSPVSELLSAAETQPLTAALKCYDLSVAVGDEPRDVDWVSFSCVLLRREVIERVGLLDEGYYMFFEDSDYCRAARETGFRVRYFPAARAVVRSLSGDLLSATREAQRSAAPPKRQPRWFYKSRARYFRKGYGPLGPWAANTCWQLGRSVSLGRELAGRKTPHVAEKAWLDNWIDAFKL
ncbi:MAG TPA: glycosyltransferase family 2 protein [Polyangiales bacterium]|nr:glycosyltransferase family 2 protein [Polyangiales bacterium]